MNSVILCRFDSVDLADLAAGRLRDKFPEISNIAVSRAQIKEPDADGDIRLPFAGAIAGALPLASGSGLPGMAFPIMAEQPEEDRIRRESDFVPRAVTMRVTCPQETCRAVRARLVNLGAQGIRSFP